MNTFLSYSVDDLALVERISEQLKPYTNLYYWDKSKEPGEDAWKQIFRWIDNSDLVVTIITDNAVARAMSVAQEIGYSKRANKLIIPLVGPNINPAELGCLQGVVHERIAADKIDGAISAIHRRINTIEEKERIQNIVIIGIIVLALIWFLTRKR